MDLRLLPLAIAAVIAIATTPAYAAPVKPASAKQPPAKPAASTKDAPSTKEAAAPKAQSGSEAKLLPVLAPEQFFGVAAMGYAAAKAVPHVCHKLFCYCGCDITDAHTNLLDCFTNFHGADCHICQEEAMHALKMDRDEQPVSVIQKFIDETYASKYPFKEDSPAYKKYKATRLWTATGAPGEGGSPAPGTSTGEACCPGK